MTIKPTDRIRRVVNESERKSDRSFVRYREPADAPDEGWLLCRLDSGFGRVRNGRIQKRDGSDCDWIDDETYDLVKVYTPVTFIKDEELVAVTKMEEDIYYPTRLTRMKSYEIITTNAANAVESITAQELLENPNFSRTYFGKNYVETHDTKKFTYPIRELAQTFYVDLDTLVNAIGSVAISYDTARSVVFDSFFITDQDLPFGDSHLVEVSRSGSNIDWKVKDRRVSTSQTVWDGTELVYIADPATNTTVSLASSNFPIDGTLQVSAWYESRVSTLRHENAARGGNERYVTDQTLMARKVNRLLEQQSFGLERNASEILHKGISVLRYANGF